MQQIKTNNGINPINFVILIDIIYIGGDYCMYNEDFSIRLAKLRTQKGVSARDMSLSIGQNPGYVNNIETGKALPSMSTFFYICDYLNISPQEFFEENVAFPEQLHLLIDDLKLLNDNQIRHISALVKDLIQSKI